MPLPLILVAAAAGAMAHYSLSKGVEAISTHRSARKSNKEASELLARSETGLMEERARCTEGFEELGRLKLDAWDQQLGRFCSLFARLRNVEVRGAVGLDEVAWSEDELVEMRRLSGYASEVSAGGLAALGSGAIIGMASYGGATMFATIAVPQSVEKMTA